MDAIDSFRSNHMIQFSYLNLFCENSFMQETGISRHHSRTSLLDLFRLNEWTCLFKCVMSLYQLAEYAVRMQIKVLVSGSGMRYLFLATDSAYDA